MPAFILRNWDIYIHTVMFGALASFPQAPLSIELLTGAVSVRHTAQCH